MRTAMPSEYNTTTCAFRCNASFINDDCPIHNQTTPKEGESELRAHIWRILNSTHAVDGQSYAQYTACQSLLLDLIHAREQAAARKALTILHEKYLKRHEERNCQECSSYGVCPEYGFAMEILQEDMMLSGKLPMVHPEDHILRDSLEGSTSTERGE